MHEYSIVGALVDRVGDEVRRVGATRVLRLHVRLGEQSGVDMGLLATAFETFRGRTVCDGAELVLTPSAVAWSCPKCGAEIPRGEKLRCETCGVGAKMVRGDEIMLERIEMEVPDV
jgi:hydrogenase nickel insertion protein HypA